MLLKCGNTIDAKCRPDRDQFVKAIAFAAVTHRQTLSRGPPTCFSAYDFIATVARSRTDSATTIALSIRGLTLRLCVRPRRGVSARLATRRHRYADCGQFFLYTDNSHT